MDVRLLRVALVSVIALVMAGCSAARVGGEPTISPGVSSPTASPQPTSTPSAQPTSTPDHASTLPIVTSAVTSPAQAAAIVFASDPLFGSIKQVEAASVGQSASYTAFESGDGYAVTITLGSGDCPATCINTHTWNYSVSRDGKVTLDSETGDPVEVSIDHGTDGPATVTVRLVAGPVCPVEKMSPDPSCAPRPVPGAEVVLRDPSGKEVGRVNADATGVAAFSVPGGAYYAEAAAVEGLMGQAEPEAFSVPSGRSVTIALEYDTGIR